MRLGEPDGWDRRVTLSIQLRGGKPTFALSKLAACASVRGDAGADGVEDGGVRDGTFIWRIARSCYPSLPSAGVWRHQ